MEILFKCDDYVYYINCDKIIRIPLDECPHFGEISNIKHLNDCQPICKLIGNYKYEHDVYYIHNETVIIKSILDDFIITTLYLNDKLDYTELNINKILNEDII